MRIHPSPLHWSWGDPPFPEWVESFRPEQLAAAVKIESLFLGGAQVVFLDAPTGAGKTLIGEMVRRRQRRPSIYLCTTKTLQDQFVVDFPYAKLIKGRNNYPTADLPALFYEEGDRHLSAAECTKERLDVPCSSCNKPNPSDINHDDRDHSGLGDDNKAMHCRWCHPWQACPYEQAKKEAMDADLAIANTSYYLHEANAVGGFGAGPERKKPRHSRFEFVVIDEADSLENELMSYVELVIPRRFIQRLALPIPDRKTVSDNWPEWAEKASKVIRKEARLLASRSSPLPDPKLLREIRRLTSLAQKVKETGPHLDDGTWIYSGYDQGQIVFRPVKVDDQAEDVLWRHSKQFLLMSATIISPDQMASDLGVPRGSWASVTVPSSFPPERRPIIYRGVANMTNKTKETAWPQLADAVKKILLDHPSERILIHTVSYALTKFLDEQLNSPHRVISYSSAGQRDYVLSQFRSTPNAVLLAPSFERGVDLPDDECRVIVIAKVPFPYLGDKQVSARLYSAGGNGWYRMQTVRSMVQMSGRGMRHEGDSCTTYVLDRQFMSNVWKNSMNIIPQWWRDAIEWEAPK